MPYQIAIPRRGTVAFPDSVSKEEAAQILAEQFPPDGQDISEALADPAFKPTEDQFKTYKEFAKTRHVDWAQKISEGLGEMASRVGGAVVEGVQGAAVNPANYAEALAQGTRDFLGMFTQSQNPDSVVFKFKNLVMGDGTLKSQYDQFIEARDAALLTSRMEAGDETLVMPKEWTNPEFIKGAKILADPTMFLPGVGEALGLGKLATRAVGGATKAAGKVVGAVARPVEAALGAGSRLVQEATGVTPGALKAGAVASGVAGVAAGIPGMTALAAAPVAVGALKDLGSVLELAGGQLGKAPSRIGPMEAVGNAVGSNLRQKAIGAIGRFGGDFTLDLGLRSAAGALEGAAIGAYLGYLNDGEEGAASGLGGGLAAGAMGAGAARIGSKMAGVAARQARAGDLGRYIEDVRSRDPSTADLLGKLEKTHGLDVASGFTDLDQIIKGTFGDIPVRLLPKEEFTKLFGNGRGVTLTGGDRPNVVINMDAFRGKGDDPFYTLAHEAFHAFEKTAQLNDKASEIKQSIAGTFLPDGTEVRQGLLTREEVIRRFDDYKRKFPVEHPERLAMEVMPEVVKADYVASELAAEYFARLVKGQKPDAILRGFGGATRGILDAMMLQSSSKALERIATSLDKAFSVRPTDSILFPGLREASPQLNAMLRSLVRGRRNLDEAVKKSDDSPTVFSQSDLKNPTVAKMAMESGMAKTEKDGTVRILTRQELKAQDEHITNIAREVISKTPVMDTSQPFARVVDGEIDGVLSKEQIAAIISEPKLPSRIKEKFAAAQKLVDEGRSAFIQYAAATTSKKSKVTGKYRSVYSSKIPITSREVIPHAVAFSKAGNPRILTIDLTKIRGSLEKRAKADGSVGPYDSIQQVFDDLAKYHTNLSQGESAARSVEVFGKDKAKFLGDMSNEPNPGGSGMQYHRDFRLDRMISMDPREFRATINREGIKNVQARWMPEEESAFYSQLTRSLKSLPQERMSVSQARAAVVKGAKKAEIEFSGILTDPLSPLSGKQAGDTVTKAELTSYAMERQAKVQDVVLGEGLSGDSQKRFEEIQLRYRILTDEIAVNRFQRENGEITLEDSRNNARRLSAERSNLDDEMNALNKQRSETHFSSYQLPGADEGSYREMFVTWPGASGVKIEQDKASGWWIVKDRNGEQVASSKTKEGALESAKEWGVSGDWSDGHSQYSDIANPIVRIRRNLRTDADSSLVEGYRYDKKFRVIHKLQDRAHGIYFSASENVAKSYSVGHDSDTHTHKAFLQIENPFVFDAEKQNWNEIDADRIAEKAFSQGYDGVIFKNIVDHGVGRVVTAPSTTIAVKSHTQIKDSNLRKTYFIEEMQGPGKGEQEKMPPELRKRIYEIGMKRALRDAVDEGADAIAWTTGEQQAERYDLSKQVDRIVVWEAEAIGVDGESLYHFQASKNGRDIIGEPNRSGISAERLADNIGKDLAAKAVDDIANKREARYSGADLKVGGGGLKRLYDQTIPSIANDLAKKFGVKVGKVDVGTPTKSTFEVLNSEGVSIAGPFDTRKEAEGELGKYGGVKVQQIGGTETVNSLPIPESLKQQQRAGNVLWMPSDADYLSAVKSGDMETARRMVDEAAKAAGYGVGYASRKEIEDWVSTILPELDRKERIALKNADTASEALFSPTASAGIRRVAEKSMIRNRDVAKSLTEKKAQGIPVKQVFRGDGTSFSVYRVKDGGRSIWATDSPKVAKTYGDRISSLLMSMSNPLVIDAEGSSFRNLVFEGERLDADDLSNIAKSRGYDGLVIRNFYDSNTDSGGDVISDHFSVFSPEQIKSADPVTYDDSGNVIPLSKRFDVRSPDIRWMPAEQLGNSTIIKSNSGLKIIRQDGKKFRLYGRDGALKGVYETQREAEKKGEKLKRAPRFQRSEETLLAMAKDSEHFKRWYQEFRGFLESFLGDHKEYAPLVSELLSATSAATSVEVNVPIAVKALKEFVETGSFDSFTFDSHRMNLQRAGRGEKLSGPKISEYSAAVFGDRNAIPVDRHIAQLFFNVDSPSSAQIKSAKRRIERIAKRLEWAPSEVQAALWAANQKRNGQKALSYEPYLEKRRSEIHSILSQDRAGEGKGVLAARAIAGRISKGTSPL